MQIVSNGRYKAALHRALVDGEQERMSFLSLVGPCLDAVVEPIPELAPQGAEFRGIKYREYLEHQQTNTLKENAALDIVRVQREIITREGSPALIPAFQML
jgi:isopenicillin N synthase-like dioxygenase